MSAAQMQREIPLLREGTQFLNELAEACRRQVEMINTAAAAEGVPSQELLRCSADSIIHILKAGMPSTEVRVRLAFQPWGPVLAASTSGLQASGAKFFPSEFEIPIARDLDDSVVAIYEEGRSFSPQDLARFLTQSFRRCYPTLTLPC